MYNYDSHVPPYVVDAFQSGLTTGAFNRSVSSIFDIQSRYYTWSLKSKHPDRDQPDDGASYPLSSVRQIANTIMDRKIGLVEGLIVDTVNGGIGFRNHSAPPHQTPYGSEWSEDILFVQPESQCVDTNLTLDFMIPEFNAQRGLVANLVLTDRGGFANLNQTYPEVDMSDLQHSPNLYDRAYKGAWLNNANTMLFLNVTNPNNKSEGSHAFDYLKSTVGKRFPLAYKDSSGDSGAIVDPYMLQTSTLFGAYIFGLDKGVHSLNVTMLNGANTTVPSKRPLYPNPFNIDSSTFSSAGRCAPKHCDKLGSPRPLTIERDDLRRRRRR